MNGKHERGPRPMAILALGIFMLAVLAVVQVEAQDSAPDGVLRAGPAPVQPLAAWVPSLSHRFRASSPAFTVGAPLDLKTSRADHATPAMEGRSYTRCQWLWAGGLLGLIGGLGVALIADPRRECFHGACYWMETAQYTVPVGFVIGAAVGYAVGVVRESQYHPPVSAH